VELDASSGITASALASSTGFHGEMILHVLDVQVGEVELLEVADHLGAGEVAEGVGLPVQMNRRRLSGGLLGLSEGGKRRSAAAQAMARSRAGLDEVAAWKIIASWSGNSSCTSDLCVSQGCGSQPFSYSRPHNFMAAASFRIFPFTVSSFSSRFTSHARLKVAVMVTEHCRWR